MLPAFHRLQYSKGCALQVLNTLSIALAETAFSVSLNQILRNILPISANMDGGNDNVQSIYFATNLGTSHFQPQSNLPDSLRWGHIRSKAHLIYHPRVTDLWSKVLISPYLSRIGRGEGFNWLVQIVYLRRQCPAVGKRPLRCYGKHKPGEFVQYKSIISCKIARLF